jgi:branched-chain amino acid transport system substrate-binding protein
MAETHFPNPKEVRMKRFRTLCGCLALLLCIGAPAMAKTVRIGLMCPLTGSWASEGQDMKQIVELLAKETNKAGGIGGMEVEIITEDDGGDPRQAALAANKLISQDVVAVIGTYGSSVTEATQGIYNEAGIVQVATGSTAIRLTEKGLPLFLRTSPRDDEQGKVAAKTILAKGAKKIAILHDNTSYAKGLADETKSLLEAQGAQIVFFDALTPGERDYNAILTKIKGTGPDFVFFTGYYPEAGLLLKQKMEMGWDVPMMGGDATNNPDLVKIAGAKAAAGFLFLSPPVPADLDTPEAKAFLTAYQQAYGSQPGSVWAVLAGDAYRVLAEAIAKGGSTKGADIAAYLKTKLKDFPGLTGPISFNAKGDRVGDLYRIYQVDETGAFKLLP